MPNKKEYKEKKDEYIKKASEWYYKNRERVLKQRKERYYSNLDKVKDYSKKYYLENKDKEKARVKKWRKENPKKYREQWRRGLPKKRINSKIYYHTNKEEVLKREKIRRSTPEEKRKKREMDKRYFENNREKIYNQIYKRKKTDTAYRIKCHLRSRLYDAFRKYSNTGKLFTSSKYGIDYKAIIEHLLKTLPKDYNEKKYHIDHIKPLCTFDFNNPEEIKKAFAPENHQWLTAHENIKKISFDGSMEIAVANRKKTMRLKRRLKKREKRNRYLFYPL